MATAAAPPGVSPATSRLNTQTAGCPIRVRLRWASALGLLDCWEEVPTHIATIGGLCAHLLDAFGSEARSEVGSGLRLWLDGFQLRESSAVRLLRDGDLLDVAPCPDSPAAGGRTKALATQGQRRVREPSKRVEKTGGPSAAKRKRVVEERGGDAEPKSKQARQIATGGKEVRLQVHLIFVYRFNGAGYAE